nr:hypothetical protein [Escherichia coli]
MDGYSESSYSATPRFAAARLPWFGLLMASFHWWRRKVNRLPPWDDV